MLSWFGSVSSDALFLSVVTVAEIELGIERQRGRNPSFAVELTQWLDVTLRAFGDHVLPLTPPIARLWGQLAAKFGNQSLDLAIAATAIEHGLTVVTRNVADFSVTGVATLDPFRPKR